MLNKKRNEREESDKMLTLTMVLTKVLLLAIAAGALWLAQTIIFEGNQLNGILRGFNIW
jgi:hypothetical protein